jgi:tRNA (guanine37-N1)-methyltransferase
MVRFLKKTLSGTIPESEMRVLISSFDVVGDIVVLKIPPDLARWGKTIAEVMLDRLPHVKTVLNQESPVKGEYRSRDLAWLAGVRKTVTISHEAKCALKVDLAKVYFSPRLAFERMRISRLVKSGEVIINMFAGVGSFSILIAKYSLPSVVYSIDINPDAVYLMRENAILNKVKKKIQVRQGDAREIIMTELIGEADRVIMPLPEKAFEYLEAAVRALKPSGGTIHYYDFVHSSKRNDPRVSVKARVEEKLSQLAKEHSVRFSRVVRSVGPNWYQVVLDIDTVPLKG